MLLNNKQLQYIDLQKFAHYYDGIVSEFSSLILQMSRVPKTLLAFQILLSANFEFPPVTVASSTGL